MGTYRKLTDEAVRNIFLSTTTTREEAERHHITQAAVSMIRNRRMYARLTVHLKTPDRFYQQEAVPA